MTIHSTNMILGNTSDQTPIEWAMSIHKGNVTSAQKDKMCPKMANSPKMAISTVRHQIHTKMKVYSWWFQMQIFSFQENTQKYPEKSPNIPEYTASIFPDIF